ncbi:MAG: DUF3631 domain-containing protein [Alphaproteobacteria bacterium]
MNDAIAQFSAAVLRAGLTPPAKIEADGALHRFPTNGKHGDDSGWYILHTDGISAGSFGCWRAGVSHTWRADIGRELTPAESQAHRKRMDAIRVEREADKAKRHADAEIRAVGIWERAQQASPDHPYAVRKGVSIDGLREHEGQLAVPMRDADGGLSSLQFIAPDGGKRFLPGGRVKGCFHLIGKPDATLCVCEGYATAASIHAATGQAVAVAFNAGNLEPVAMALRLKYPETKIIVCGDADKSGVGQAKAQEAAAAVGGSAVLPAFTPDELAADSPPTDFNDMAALRGPEAVKDIIQGAKCASGADQPTPPANDPGADFDATVAHLAALKPHEYDRVRTAEATRLGVRAATLDDAVTGQRAQQSGGAASLFPDVEPWPDPVDGAALLDEVAATVRRFIVCDPEIAETAALWILFTWLVDRFDIAPMILITAPEMRCGKTQFLIVIGKMVRRPLAASNLSPAVVYHVIEADAPTLLIDEADSFFRDNEDLRGIVNSGHGRETAYVLRMVKTVGDNFAAKRFSTWGAKVLCGIGRLQNTLMDRSLVLELRRKGPGETAAKLRHADPAVFGAIASKLSRYADDHGAQVGQARPNIPNALHDRAQDNWEPLLAIADHAGGGWPERARSAALKIAGATAEADDLRGGLLQDIQAVFTATGQDRISTADLLAALIADDTKSYATWARGKPMTARHLANKLADYKIAPGTIRIGGSTAKGFLLSDFAETFARYLPAPPDTPFLAVTPSQPAEDLDFFDNLAVTRTPDVTARKQKNIRDSAPCDGVTDRNPLPGKEACFDGAESELEADL